MRKLHVVFIILAVFSTAAHAQEDWILAADTTGSKYHILAGSFEESVTKGGTDIAVVVGRVTNDNTGRIVVEKWYVSTYDCKRGMGTIVTLDINGNYQYENEFVFSAGNVASGIAEMICGALQLQVEERRKKSI